MPGISIKDIPPLIEKYWVRKSGLVTAIILCVFFETSFIIAAGFSWWIGIGILILSILFIVFLWFNSWRPPKTPKGKIGFLVSIFCSEDEESKKIKEDFIVPLRKLVKSGTVGKAFHFMELPQNLAEMIIDPDDAHIIRVKCHAHFIIYGRVRLRKIKGKLHHVIDLEGGVAHNPIPENISKKFSKEFAELLPRKVRISKEDDLLSFQFTSEWADIVARYIMGIAAALSGDLGYAETLYIDAQNRLESKDQKFPIFLTLSKRIPIRISELNETKAVVAYASWLKTNDENYINLIGMFLGKIDKSQSQKIQVIQLKSIFSFLRYRNIEKSIAILKNSQNQNYPEWYLSMAFLHAYKGDLKAAIRFYRHASLFEMHAATISQIEDFICLVLEKEPDKYQLHYCLGFFNWKIKGDHIQSQEDFQAFLEARKPNEFEKEGGLTQKWLEEISQKTY